MRFSQYLKSKLTVLMGLSLISALLVAAIMPTLPTKADGPRFNFRGRDDSNPLADGDWELFTGRIASRNESAGSFRDPIGDPANPASLVRPQEEVEGQIYYHNGEPQTFAQHTTIKLTIPDTTANKTARLDASIEAEGVAPISDTVVDGNIVGRSGLTVNYTQDVAIEPVLGSVQWFPNTRQHPDADPIMLGSAGDALFTPGGLDLGTIEGCWEFAGFVRFKFTSAPSIGVDFTKTVRNIDRNTPVGGYADTVAAKYNEIVEFKINAANSTVIPAGSVIKDTFPSELSFVEGSLVKTDAGVDTTLTTADFNALLGSGYVIDRELPANSTFALTFKAKVNTNVDAQRTVTNTATLVIGDISLIAHAYVSLEPIALQVELHKGATNTTTGKQATQKVVSGRTVLALDAEPGNEIVYSLTTTNRGTFPINYVVQDGIADILEEADVTQIADSGKIVNGSTGNDAKLVQWPSVTLQPNTPLTLTFTIKVKNPLPNNPASGFHFDDQLYNKYGDEVIVFINRPVKKAELNIVKTVRNVQANEVNFVKSNEAFAGDTLEYRIDFTNTGNASLDGVVFKDVLPPNTQYIDGTTVMPFSGVDKTVQEGITAGGIKIATIGAGESGYIKFKVTTSPNLAAGEKLVNTVTVTAKDIVRTDTATTTIKAKAVVTPTTPVPQLPRTGSAAGSSFIVTFLMGIAGTYVKYRKLIGDELEVVRIANDILKR